MKTLAVVLMVLLLTSSVSAEVLDHFSTGAKTADLDLAHGTSVTFKVPTDSYVLNATVTATGRPDASGDYPNNVTVRLNGDKVWGFNGTDYGAWGNQAAFLNNTTEVQGLVSNGTLNATTLLPKGAITKDAKVELSQDPYGLQEVLNGTYHRGGAYDWSTPSYIGNIGDVNGDGLDDFAVSLPQPDWGHEIDIFYGGAAMDNVPDTRITSSSYITEPVGVGDFSGDGYDDLAVVSDYKYIFLYLGGPTWDVQPDLLFENVGTIAGLASVGDMNGDGHPDFAVSSTVAEGPYTIDEAHVFFGGSLDNVSDVNILGLERHQSQFEYSNFIDGGRDLNQDGYPDLVVGVPLNRSVHVVFGGPSMDNLTDLLIKNNLDTFGWSPKIVKDLNGDKVPDLVVGGIEHALVFFGGAGMDDVPDLTVYVKGSYKAMYVFDVGDINNDGSDDVGFALHDVYQGPANSLPYFYVLFGGKDLDEKIDREYDYKGPYNYMLEVMAGSLGDINKDGYNETGVTFYYLNFPGGTYLEFHLLVENRLGTSTLTVNGALGWSEIFRGNKTIDLTGYMSYIISQGASFIDGSGNTMVYINFSLVTADTLRMRLANLTIIYDYPVVINMTDRVRATVAATQGPVSNFTLGVDPLPQGVMNLSELDVVLDRPPSLVQGASFYIEEASIKTFDLTTLVKDDYTPLIWLSYSLSGCTEGNHLHAQIVSVWKLEVSMTDPNWTGPAYCDLKVVDGSGLWNITKFTIVINNTNDPPVIVSLPFTKAIAGRLYAYSVVAVDGDKDPLTYTLDRAPPGMVFNGSILEWSPTRSLLLRSFNVTLNVSDGRSFCTQAYRITVIGDNSPPSVDSLPDQWGYVGEDYTYQVKASDIDGDALTYGLMDAPTGMALDNNHTVHWVPTSMGNFTVAIIVKDYITEVYQNFTLTVLRKNRAPLVPAIPTLFVKAGHKLVYALNASDPDGDGLTYTFTSAPNGMSVKNGSIVWDTTAKDLGVYTVLLNVSDGSLWVTRSFTVNVTGPKLHPTQGLVSIFWPLIILLVVVAIIVLVVYLNLRRAKGPRQKVGPTS